MSPEPAVAVTQAHLYRWWETSPVIAVTELLPDEVAHVDGVLPLSRLTQSEEESTYLVA